MYVWGDFNDQFQEKRHTTRTKIDIKIFLKINIQSKNTFFLHHCHFRGAIWLSFLLNIRYSVLFFFKLQNNCHIKWVKKSLMEAISNAKKQKRNDENDEKDESSTATARIPVPVVNVEQTGNMFKLEIDCFGEVFDYLYK